MNILFGIILNSIFYYSFSSYFQTILTNVNIDLKKSEEDLLAKRFLLKKSLARQLRSDELEELKEESKSPEDLINYEPK